MKLTDFLQDVGRPVAYYPHLRKITGSTNATILLCQFIYWLGKQRDPNGWLYKTSEEIEDETGLSYEEQRGARKKLVENGLLEEYYARLDHKIKFRIITNAINTLWSTDENLDGEQGNSSMPNKEIPCSLTDTTSKTTKEECINSENEISNFDPPEPTDEYTEKLTWLEEITGLPARPGDSKTIDKFVEMKCLREDIQNGYNWYIEQGKTLRYYGQLIGPTEYNIAKRIRSVHKTKGGNHDRGPEWQKRLNSNDVWVWYNTDTTEEQPYP